MNPGNCSKAIAALALSVVLLFAGCSRGEEPAAPVTDATSRTPSQAALALLAKADASDGNADKVVSKCVICALGMDGTAEHSASYGEYKLHLCSEFCREAFTEDPEKALLALKFPEEKQ